jgi:hypothetical protein
MFRKRKRFFLENENAMGLNPLVKRTYNIFSKGKKSS